MPDDVAEPGPGDQQDGVGDDVPGDDELEPGPGGVQIGVDGGGGDVDDGGIEDRHELPGEDDGQQGARRGRPTGGAAFGPVGGPAEPGAAASRRVVAGYGG